MGQKYLEIVGCMLVCSFYIRLALYISAYDMQHRSYGDRHRFAVVDRGDLGFWKYFILFPKNLKDKNKVFVITAEFEKRALVSFLRDIAIDIVLGYIFTVGDTYSLICMWFFVYTIVCIILNPIHSISDQINSLPKKIEITERMLEKHILKHYRMLRKQYDESEYTFERADISKRDKWETVDTIIVCVLNPKGAIVQQDELATRRHSKYYTDSEITLK